MGNSSSTPSSSSTTTATTTHGEHYDVFISFRGTDTRKGFTSHLYRALDEKGITTFIDTKLVRGEEISDGLWRAIGKSKISVVIFSENYASSEWCLLELEEIMKYKDTNNQIVIPVFYQVDPSHVENQTGSYEAAFVKHGNELQQDKVKKWRDTLTRASGLSGWDSSVASNEAEFISNIVRDVWNKLNNILPSCNLEDLVKKLVGIEKHIAGVVSKLFLEVQDFRIIGIWGMGGMGKTTIADAVFQIISDQFENRTYFTVSVRAESENGLIRLRNNILSKVLKIENKNPDDRSIPQWIKEMLKQKKFLIVLDDVDSFRQLETLAGDLDRLGLGSRIIVTTRDKQVLRNCGVKDHNMYEVKGLNDDEALQLFCKHAFKQNHPTIGFADLSREVLKIATNVPLAVTVLGSLLNGKKERDWANAVDKFKRNVNPTVLDVLQISYDGLDEEEKGLFLDIACFVGIEFQIKKEVFAPNLLSDRGFSLSRLIDKSLVTVGEYGHIKMHDLLREMGTKIASENRSRLWKQKDVLRTLEHNDGTYAVHGIFLNMHKLKDLHLISQAFRKIYNLRVLITYNDCDEDCENDFDEDYDDDCDEVHLRNGSLDYLPDELRYLHWRSYPLEVLPSSFNPENLVELDLSYSKINQLWEGSTCVPKLKWLNLDSCRNLISIDLSNIPSAEIINLKDCCSLSEIHSSRECPKNLHFLNLEGCESLSSFTSNIHLSEDPSFSTTVILHSSREGLEFNLSGCSSLTKFPDISGNIKRLDLAECFRLEDVPSTIQSLSKLESLNMQYCVRLKHISESICNLKSLNRLNLRVCNDLESFPDISEGMELKYLNLCETAIKELPPSIGNLNRLEKLYLSCCKNLETLPSSISNLKSLDWLDLWGCYKLESFPDILEGMELKYLNLSGTAIKELPPSIGNLNRLEELDLNCCENLETLPSSIFNLKSLDRLDLSRCCKLESFPDILEGMELKYLDLSRTAIKELPPSIGNLNRLEELDLSDCISKLEKLPPLSGLCSLKKLRLNNLNLTEIPEDIGCLSSLEMLELDGNVFERLPKSIKKLSKLYHLSLRHCGMLQSLPELPSSLRYLDARNCKQLILSLPDESKFELCPDGSGSLYFNFLNCLELNQKAVSNLLMFFQVFVQKMQLMGTKKIISLFKVSPPPIPLTKFRFFPPDEEVKGSLCLPGSEIPEWFCHKNIGSSINNIPVLQNDCGSSSYIMGFEACLVFGYEEFDNNYDPGNFDVRYDFHLETSDGHKEGLFHESITVLSSHIIPSCSDHILLVYNLSRKCYEFFQELDTRLANGDMSDYVGTSFEFNIQPTWHSPDPKKGCKVKYCGIQPIYVQAQVMSSVSINQDTGDTSGCNDTAEETCEPHPKRICTEAKDF